MHFPLSSTVQCSPLLNTVSSTGKHVFTSVFSIFNQIREYYIKVLVKFVLLQRDEEDFFFTRNKFVCCITIMNSHIDWSVDWFSSLWKSFTHTEMSPLPVKGYKFWLYTCSLDFSFTSPHLPWHDAHQIPNTRWRSSYYLYLFQRPMFDVYRR
jgi:hypothetical protein